MLICSFILFTTFARALLTPPHAWDAILYHLTYPAFWIKQGTLAHFNALESLSITNTRYLPINGEIFAAWLLLPFHNDILVNLMNFPLTLLGGIACYALTREMGFAQKDAIWTPALICFSPVIYFHMTSQILANALFAFSAASALFICRFLKSGLLSEGLMSLISAGILLGVQYNGVPIVLVVFIFFAAKTMQRVKRTPVLRKLALICLGLSIMCMLGGRQYIHNAIDAHNPVYPFPMKILGHELFEGWPRFQDIEAKLAAWELERGLDKFSWWEREYRKFLYLAGTAGPKFFLFFILASLSLVIRPRHTQRSVWYCLALMWIVPLVIFYGNSSTSLGRRGFFMDGSARHIVASIALFSIQALALIHTWKHYFKPHEVFLSLLVVWDLLRIYEKQRWEIEVTYPLLIVLLAGTIVFYKIAIRGLKGLGNSVKALPKLGKAINGRGLIVVASFIFLFAGFYFLQVYKDATRYSFYAEHFKNSLPERLVNAWEFMDNPNEKKTIAMAMDFSGANWFFYPLFGRYLQNDIAYISAKYIGEMPTWYDKGTVRGVDFSVWLYNVKKTNVDYLFVTEPMPTNELQWIDQQKKMFQLVFSDKHSKIFKHLKEEK